MCSLIVTRDLEGASRTRRAFLEDQDDFFAFQMFLLSSRIFRTLQVACEIEEVPKLPLCKVLHRQQRPVAKIEAHLVLLGKLECRLVGALAPNRASHAMS